LAERDEIGGWPIEEISDQDDLFMGVHKRYLNVDRSVQLGAFRNHNGGMSTNWSKYSTPEETRQQRRTPLANAVIQMNVGSVRAVSGQSVKHTPNWERKNRAHTDVLGEKDEESRVVFGRIATVVIALEQDA
jgi:hypothetical protein